MLGEPPQTGTAVLMVNVEDVNDNAPQVRVEPLFTVDSQARAGDEVARFYIDDADSEDNGPPFEIRSECNAAECTGYSLESGTGGLTS